jgi:hypothetical protein
MDIWHSLVNLADTLLRENKSRGICVPSVNEVAETRKVPIEAAKRHSNSASAGNLKVLINCIALPLRVKCHS